MKTKYKYIHFRKVYKDDKSWLCCTNKDEIILGEVAFYQRWKQYIFVPWSGTEYSHDCLTDISDFLQQLNQPK